MELPNFIGHIWVVYNYCDFRICHSEDFNLKNSQSKLGQTCRGTNHLTYTTQQFWDIVIFLKLLSNPTLYLPLTLDPSATYKTKPSATYS